MLPMIFALAGVAWIARAVIGLTQPTYYAPETPLDFAAVWAFTIALSLSAAGLALLASRWTGAARAVALIGAAAALIAGVGNALEDAFGMDGAGWPMYVFGAVVTLLAFIAIAVLAFRRRDRAGAASFGAAAVGFLLADVGGLALTGLAFLVLAWSHRSAIARPRTA